MGKYSRILLKLSGESLAGESGSGINESVLDTYAKQIIGATNAGCEIAIVVGGGNIFRGLSGSKSGFDRVKGDQMGMLATVINSIAMENAINNNGGKAKVFTSINMAPVGQYYRRDDVVDHLSEGYICLIAGGTGNPFFTTDSASALRAVEIGADVLLKGTRVDGVYTADPEKDKNAVKYQKVTFDEAISKQLKIMDLTAFTMCRENAMPIIVFDMNREGNLMKIIAGENPGTLISAK